VKERFAAVLAWNTNVWPKSGKHPTKLTDIFNTKEFPGKRCLFGAPDFGGTLEVALLADGVSPKHMYPINIDRALKKLGTIKNDIVWWSAGDQATQDLLSGECNLGLVWQGRVYDRILQDPSTPLAISWNHPIILNAWLGIQKGSHHLRAAESYLACQVLCTNGLKSYVKLIAYPTPVKGLYGKLSAKLRPWVAAGPNVKNGIVQDDVFYAKHLQQFTQKFDAFMNG
jgi:putative spermidine/putrescine transport system substrate-binding protein